ncbi:MAG: Holliday junction branch migration protein RuvA [Methanoregulaceae archaeon]|nr:Holliday junction branch migration protein RuvA [Methanoregulaceae archaeon]
MISLLTGQVVHIGENFALIDVQGIGFEVRMTKPGLQEIGRIEKAVRVHTYLAVRDEEMLLYGFLRQSELEMFRMLISVTRVGPVLALSILSQISIPEFAAAILDEDEQILTRISGIGQKNAKRLILELKDKMKKKAGEFGGEMMLGTDPAKVDAVRALVALGFRQRESNVAVERVVSGMKSPETSQVIKAALAELRER